MRFLPWVARTLARAFATVLLFLVYLVGPPLVSALMIAFPPLFIVFLGGLLYVILRSKGSGAGECDGGLEAGSDCDYYFF